MTSPSRKFLLVDTADRIAMIGIYDGERILAETRACQGRPSLSWIDGSIRDLCKSCGINLRDLEYLACGTGPGGFTSLRMGLSFTKALGQALDLPMVGVNRLEAAAIGQAALSGDTSGQFWVRLPAARDLEYLAVYRMAVSGLPVCLRLPAALSPSRISRIRMPKSAKFVTANPELFYLGIPRAAHLKASAGQFESAETILPMYLRGVTLGPRQSAVKVARKMRLR